MYPRQIQGGQLQVVLNGRKGDIDDASIYGVQQDRHADKKQYDQLSPPAC